MEKKSILKITGIVSGIVVLVLMINYVFVSPMNNAWAFAKKGYELKTNTAIAVTTKDWVGIQRELANANEFLNESDALVDSFRFLSVFPLVRGYYEDIPEIKLITATVIGATLNVMDELGPYKSILGFSDEIQVEGKEQKLEEIIKKSPQLVPAVRGFMKEVEPIFPVLEEIDYDKYRRIRGMDNAVNWLNANVKYVKDYWQDAEEFLTYLPTVLGEPDAKKYLILFQNDKELRPTGGFLTSYSLTNISSGQISIDKSYNIYEIADPGLYPPPAPIRTYLKQSQWFLRDTNFSPDYKDSMEFFISYWDDLGLENIDGVLGVDTEFVAGMLDLLGPIQIDGYDTDFGAWAYLPESCKVGGSAFTVENVVCRLEFYAEKTGASDAQRKEIIGLLMNEMFSRLMTIPSKDLFRVVEVGTDLLNRKHLLLYFKDLGIQRFAEKYNWAGRLVQDNDTTDYFALNDANLAGLKSDMYIKRSVTQEIKSGNGKVEKTVTISYFNSGAFDGWLNATGRNYLRVYVPQGSKLVETSGGEATTSVYDDLSFTVFDNFMLIPPLKTATITFTYELPKSVTNWQSIQIVKQPGVESIDYKFINDDHVVEKRIQTDTTIVLDQE